ncbi:MAG TPA: zf-HC2 domain-containing protein [Candidatus Polarisedimenticolia bacterium]|nr:zf-HC2 domain-containing protein [Candidatus Polarisedimenticolia bacterium]
MDHGSGTTRVDCTSIAPLLGHYLAEQVDEATRMKVRTHLLTCPSCSTEALKLDPSILFVGLGQERPSPESWARFDVALRSRIEAEAGKRRGIFSGWDFSRLETAVRMPRLAFATPLAMLAVLAGLVFVSQPGMILRGPRPRIEAIRPPHEIGGPVRPAPDPRGPAGGFDTGRHASLRLAGAEAALLPTLEEVSSPAARVYRLDVGASAAAATDGTDSSAVYFVVDETINF